MLNTPFKINLDFSLLKRKSTGGRPATDYLLMALGKNKEYALNVAEFAKVIAEKNNYHLQIWDDTKENPLKLNQNSINRKKEMFMNVKSLK